MTWRYCISQSSVPIGKKWFFHASESIQIHWFFFSESPVSTQQNGSTNIYTFTVDPDAPQNFPLPRLPRLLMESILPSHLKKMLANLFFFNGDFADMEFPLVLGRFCWWFFQVVGPSGSKSSWSNADAPVRNEGLGRSQIANVAGNPSR